jgi:hypothetical protein
LKTLRLNGARTQKGRAPVESFTLLASKIIGKQKELRASVSQAFVYDYASPGRLPAAVAFEARKYRTLLFMTNVKIASTRKY